MARKDGGTAILRWYLYDREWQYGGKGGYLYTLELVLSNYECASLSVQVPKIAFRDIWKRQREVSSQRILVKPDTRCLTKTTVIIDPARFKIIRTYT